MRRTPYSTTNAEFSNAAHVAARTQIYPKIFDLSVERLEFESTLLTSSDKGEVLDGDLGIDRIVRVRGRPEFLHQPLVFTVQERFRRPEYAHFADITITEWNRASGLPSELYKIAALIFLYGYFDEEQDKFLDALAFDVGKALRLICNEELTCGHRYNKRSEQDFIALGFENLYETGCVIFWQNGPEDRRHCGIKELSQLQWVEEEF